MSIAEYFQANNRIRYIVIFSTITAIITIFIITLVLINKTPSFTAQSFQFVAKFLFMLIEYCLVGVILQSLPHFLAAKAAKTTTLYFLFSACSLFCSLVFIAAIIELFIFTSDNSALGAAFAFIPLYLSAFVAIVWFIADRTNRILRRNK